MGHYYQTKLLKINKKFSFEEKDSIFFYEYYHISYIKSLQIIIYSKNKCIYLVICLKTSLNAIKITKNLNRYNSEDCEFLITNKRPLEA